MFPLPRTTSENIDLSLYPNPSYALIYLLPFQRKITITKYNQPKYTPTYVHSSTCIPHQIKEAPNPVPKKRHPLSLPFPNYRFPSKLTKADPSEENLNPIPAKYPGIHDVRFIFYVRGHKCDTPQN